MITSGYGRLASDTPQPDEIHPTSPHRKRPQAPSPTNFVDPQNIPRIASLIRPEITSQRLTYSLAGALLPGSGGQVETDTISRYALRFRRRGVIDVGRAIKVGLRSLGGSDSRILKGFELRGPPLIHDLAYIDNTPLHRTHFT
jgi:hypothetical protein